MNMPRDSLDSLLEAALIEHGNTLRGKRALRTPQDFDSNYRVCFTRPENWTLRMQVQLVHAEGNVRTLVGLFDEFIHNTVPRCRRLVAASTTNPDLPRSSEEVTGDHWLPRDTLFFKQKPPERTLELVADLDLEMGQHLCAQAALLKASLVGGGIQRLILQEDTVFEGTTPRTILSLPVGLDILEGLSSLCKAAVWRAMSEQLGA